MKTLLSLLLLIFSLQIVAQEVEDLILLSRWSDSTLVGSRAYNNAYNEVWGLKVGSSEYAIIGSTYGTHFINVTDPSNISEILRVPGAVQGPQIIHRDYHDYECYLYAVSDEGASTLQIMDISNLPLSAPIVYESADLIQRGHNIFIDTSSAKLYSFATNGTVTGGAALTVIDISNPIEPKFIANHKQFGNITAGHVHDAYIINDTAYLNLGPSGFAIVDFTDPLNPFTINTLRPSEYPGAGYNHSCWRSDDGSAVYMADETWGSDVKVVDVRDHLNLDIPMTFNAGSSNQFSIPHNQVVACNYLYISYYYDGIQVYDISNPLQPVRSHQYATTNIPYRKNYEGSWGVYPLLPSGIILVSDMQEGLFVFEAIDSDCNDVVSCPLTTGVDFENLISVDISPNPSTDWIKINSSHDGQIILHSANGLKMKSWRITTESNHVNISSLSNGLYFIQMENQFFKFIKI